MKNTGMTTQDWINVALSGKPVWNIGQIDKPTARALDKMVQQGVLEKDRAHWMHISPLKTVWHLPGNNNFLF